MVSDLLWKEGRVYDLPDAMDKNEKNFAPMSEGVILEDNAETAPEATQSTTSPVKGNTCGECGKECKNLAGLRAHQRSHKEVK